MLQSPNAYLYNYRNTTRRHYNETFHAHEGIEFCYVHEGFGDLWLDGRHYEVVPGTLMVFQPFQLHRVRMRVTEELPFVRTVLTFDPRQIEDALSLFPELLAFFRHLHEDLLPMPILTGWAENDLAIRHLQYTAGVLRETPLQHRREEYVHLLLTFLRLVRHRWLTREAAKPLPLRSPHRAEQIMKWVDSHYTEEFQMERMAGDLFLSGSHLSRLFREATGNTITDYLAAKRMKEACRLLTTTTWPIPEVAARVGLANPSYFCQAFKKKLGVSPHRYRLINRSLRI